MQLLQELIQINRTTELETIFEELGNLGKLGLGQMVNAFKQSYSTYSKGREGIKKQTSEVKGKFTQDHMSVGKDSEAFDCGKLKNWNAVKKYYKENSSDTPVALIVKVDDNPVALMIAREWDLTGVNEKIVLAWDFSKAAPTEEEAKKLTAGLNSKGSPGRWNSVVNGSDTKPGVSSKKETEEDKNYDSQKHEYVSKFTTKKYTGFTQTVREVGPFINNICDAFSGRVTATLIFADKVRGAKRGERAENRPIDPKSIKLFKDDISTRLAKYKNTKIDSAESAEDFVKKIFSGGLKKLKFAGRSYSAVPEKQHMGSSGGRKHAYFYNGTMQTLIQGKPVTMEFSADRQENDYATLYLVVKLVNGTLTPVSMRYDEKDGDEDHNSGSKTINW